GRAQRPLQPRGRGLLPADRPASVRPRQRRADAGRSPHRAGRRTGPAPAGRTGRPPSGGASLPGEGSGVPIPERGRASPGTGPMQRGPVGAGASRRLVARLCRVLFHTICLDLLTGTPPGLGSGASTASRYGTWTWRPSPNPTPDRMHVILHGTGRERCQNVG